PVIVECAASIAAAAPPGGGLAAELRTEPAVNVVDVAADAATPELIAQLVRLAADERVVSIDDRPADHSFARGAWHAARVGGDHGSIGRGYHIVLAGRGAAGSRRVLVLLH